MKSRQTNAEFAKNNKEFRGACAALSTDEHPFPPTQRQASKWRKQRGQAYKSLFTHYPTTVNP